MDILCRFMVRLCVLIYFFCFALVLNTAFYVHAEESSHKPEIKPIRDPKAYSRDQNSINNIITGIGSFFESTFSNIAEQCDNNCEPSTMGKHLIDSTDTQYQQLYNKVKSTHHYCQKDIINAMAKEVANRRLPKSCLHHPHRESAECMQIKKDIDIIQSRMKGIGDLVYGQDPSSNTSATANCIDCAISNNVFSEVHSPFKPIQVLKLLHPECEELEVGESKMIYPNHPQWPLTIPYRIKKHRPDSYSITFPIKLVIDNKYDGDVPKDKAPEHYRQFIQNCLKKANKHLLGPNGEKLSIRITKPIANKAKKKSTTEPFSPYYSECSAYKKPKHQTPSRTIAIGSKSMLSNMGGYSANIDCGATVHEILHLTGLSDEYVHDSYCRVAVPNNKDSVMSHHDDVWDAVVNNNNNNSKKKSLLNTSQWNRILYGNCVQKNQLFNQCSALAYTSHKEQNCVEQQKLCLEKNALGWDKKNTIANLKEEIKKYQNTQELLKKIKQAEQQEQKIAQAQEGQGFPSLSSLKGLFVSDTSSEKEYEKAERIVEKAIQKSKEQLEVVRTWPD